MALRDEQQRMPAKFRVSADSDCAADRATRTSTVGMVQGLGRHPVETASNLHTSVGLNVSACEFYALVHGAVHGLGLQAHMRHLGIVVPLIIESDSSKCDSVREPTRLGQPTACSNTLLVDLRHGCSKQFRDQEGTNSGQHQRHVDESNRPQNPRQTSQTKGFVEVRARELHKQ